MLQPTNISNITQSIFQSNLQSPRRVRPSRSPIQSNPIQVRWLPSSNRSSSWHQLLRCSTHECLSQLCDRSGARWMHLRSMDTGQGSVRADWELGVTGPTWISTGNWLIFMNRTYFRNRQDVWCQPDQAAPVADVLEGGRITRSDLLSGILLLLLLLLYSVDKGWAGIDV